MDIAGGGPDGKAGCGSTGHERISGRNRMIKRHSGRRCDHHHAPQGPPSLRTRIKSSQHDTELENVFNHDHEHIQQAILLSIVAKELSTACRRAPWAVIEAKSMRGAEQRHARHHLQGFAVVPDVRLGQTRLGTPLHEGRQMILKHCSAAIIAASLIVFAGQVRAQDAHGAIVVGQTADGDSIAYGFAWNYGANDEATAAALNACLGSGGTNCEELARFRNGCGALALDQFGHAGGTGAMSQEQAEAGALRRCEAAGGSGCAVVGSQCASPGGQIGTWSGSERVLAPPEMESAEREAEQPTQAAEVQEEALTREQRIRVQKGLAALGFDAGPADGIFGPRTRAAIWDWQAAKELDATGYLSVPEAEALAAVGAEASETLDMEVGTPTAQESGGTEAETATASSKSRNEVLYFPTCGTDDARPDGCWLALTSPAECVMWTDALSDKRALTWSGGCDDTLRASGRGTLKGGDRSESGEFVEGKQHGQWVAREVWKFEDEDVVIPNMTMTFTEEGPYVDGERHGLWIERTQSDDGITSVGEGFYVDGEKHGHWVTRSSNGNLWEGPYVDGKQHGRWVENIRLDDEGTYGWDSDGPYVEGRRHGRWTTRYIDSGSIEVQEYRHGEVVP